MQIPAAMTIESAVESLHALDPRWRDDEVKELVEAIGADTASKLGVSFPLSQEMKVGYLLGLQAARATIATSGEVLVHGADADKIL